MSCTSYYYNIFRIAMFAHYLLLVVFIPIHSVTRITKKCFAIRISGLDSLQMALEFPSEKAACEVPVCGR